MLYKKIKEDYLDARWNKDSDKISLLTTLIGESSKLSKDSHGGEPTDSEMIKTVKKFINNLDELLSYQSDNIVAKKEKSILELYLPKQMSEEDIRLALVSSGIDLSDKKSIGLVMNHFKKSYEGLYDSKLVMKVLKEIQA